MDVVNCFGVGFFDGFDCWNGWMMLNVWTNAVEFFVNVNISQYVFCQFLFFVKLFFFIRTFCQFKYLFFPFFSVPWLCPRFFLFVAFINRIYYLTNCFLGMHFYIFAGAFLLVDVQRIIITMLLGCWTIVFVWLCCNFFLSLSEWKLIFHYEIFMKWVCLHPSSLWREKKGELILLQKNRKNCHEFSAVLWKNV